MADRYIGVASVIPGEVDTNIQKILRETTSFHLHELFITAHQEGGLISPAICTEFIKWFLCDLPFADYQQSNLPCSIYDEWHHAFWLKDHTKLPVFPFYLYSILKYSVS